MKYSYLFIVILLFSRLCAQEKFTVYFDTDIDVPNANSAGRLQKWLMGNKGAYISEIHAYTDSTGTPAYNFELSKRRLSGIIDQIIHTGILYKQIKTQAWGEEKSGSGSLDKNRRVDIFYTKPEPAKELEKAVVIAKKGEKLKLNGLNFYNNSGRVLPESEPVLEELLNILRKNENLVIEIQGHICCRPGDPDNVSELRAKAIYDFLIYYKINPKRLSYKGFGSAQPIVPLPEKTEEERVINRRVEIEIIEN